VQVMAGTLMAAALGPKVLCGRTRSDAGFVQSPQAKLEVQIPDIVAPGTFASLGCQVKYTVPGASAIFSTT
jgi:hypothetical protein